MDHHFLADRLHGRAIHPHFGGYKDMLFDGQVNIKLIAKNSYLFLIFGFEKKHGHCSSSRLEFHRQNPDWQARASVELYRLAFQKGL